MRLTSVLICLFACLVLISADSFARGGRGGGSRGGFGGRGGSRGGMGRTGFGRGRRGTQKSAKQLEELQKAEDRLALIAERRKMLQDDARKELVEGWASDRRVESIDDHAVQTTER